MKKVTNYLQCLKQLPRIFLLVWRAYPLGTILIPIITLISSPLPAVYLYSWKKVIDGVGLWIGGNAADGRGMVVLFIGFGFAITIARLCLERISNFIEQLLRLRLMHHVQKQILDEGGNIVYIYEKSN